MKKTPDKDPFAGGGRQGRTSVTPMNAEDAALMELIIFLGEEDERTRQEARDEDKKDGIPDKGADHSTDQ